MGGHDKGERKEKQKTDRSRKHTQKKRLTAEAEDVTVHFISVTLKQFSRHVHHLLQRLHLHTQTQQRVTFLLLYVDDKTTVCALPCWQKCIFLHTTAGVQASPWARESMWQKKRKNKCNYFRGHLLWYSIFNVITSLSWRNLWRPTDVKSVSVLDLEHFQDTHDMQIMSRLSNKGRHRLICRLM